MKGDGIKSRLPFRIFSTLNKYEYVQSEMRLSLAHFFITLIIWSTWGFEVFLRSWTTSTKDCRSSRPAIIIWKCPIQAPNIENQTNEKNWKSGKKYWQKNIYLACLPNILDLDLVSQAYQTPLQSKRIAPFCNNHLQSIVEEKMIHHLQEMNDCDCVEL